MCTWRENQLRWSVGGPWPYNVKPYRIALCANPLHNIYMGLPIAIYAGRLSAALPVKTAGVRVPDPKAVLASPHQPCSLLTHHMKNTILSSLLHHGEVRYQCALYSHWKQRAHLIVPLNLKLLLGENVNKFILDLPVFY